MTTKMTLPLAEMPAAISDSIAVTLKAHGLTFSPELLGELGRNTAQALCALDENLLRPDDGEVLMVGHTLRALAAKGEPNQATAPTLKSVGDWLVDLVMPGASSKNGKAA